ncbi:flagellar brake protein [Methylomonas rosea]|uniref:Flagellar brake protein YcgR n=1 Tax=Methylomonas rosea TaxID=2952227 RepID=A0ABT1TNJ4_9GAMM|nr:flagellar brake protein [Methylomonas sp. WSC-7]MCQ8116349.1 flagellar brake protein [Methylomonas sp. WSC-7]
MEKESDYLVRSAKLIFSHLSDLIKKKCIISAHFGEHNQSFLTTIIDLDQKANLITLDVAPTELLNKQLLGSAKVLFRTEYEGIKVSFRGKAIKKSQSDGHPVFAMPIPDAIFWMQRRQYYRVKVPLSHKNSTCELNLTLENEAGEMDTQTKVFGMADISLSGFSFLNADTKIADFLVPDTVIDECALYLHDGSRAHVGFVIKSVTNVRANATTYQHRIGCKFTHMPQVFENNIQRYMQEIELQQKNLSI